jgi:ABC-type multidrug transport system ATPase subunit
MDPIQTRELREHLIRAARDRAVLVSSHAVADLQALASRVAVLREGRLVADGTPAALCAAAGADRLEDAVVALLEETPPGEASTSGRPSASRGAPVSEPSRSDRGGASGPGPESA